MPDRAESIANKFSTTKATYIHSFIEQPLSTCYIPVPMPDTTDMKIGTQEFAMCGIQVRWQIVTIQAIHAMGTGLWEPTETWSMWREQGNPL